MSRRVDRRRATAGEQKRVVATLRFSEGEVKAVLRALESMAWLPAEGYNELRSAIRKLREAVR